MARAPIKFSRSAAAPLVVLLHGTAGSPRQWRDLIDCLPHDFETAALDLPGYTAHEVPAVSHSLTSEAEMIFRKLRGLGRPVHLVGHSYGGALALRIAVTWPMAISSLTLFEPAIFHLLRDGEPIERQMHKDIASVEQDLRVAEAEGEPTKGAARFIDFWNGPGTFAEYTPEVRQRVIARLPLILANFTALNQETWPLADCGRVMSPMLGLYGENSPLLTHHLTRLVAGQMDDAKVLPVSGAGHLLPLTHAALAARFLTTHIRAAEARHPRLAPRVA